MKKKARITTGRTQVIKSPKIGRNAPCHCGSGRKFKHCHLNKKSVPIVPM